MKSNSLQLDREAKRRIMLFALLFCISVVCLIAVYLPRGSPQLAEIELPQPVLYGAYDVVRVVDGDTLIVSVDGSECRIRMIGIDTPESVHPDASRNTEQGKAAAAYTTELLTGKQVYLEYDTDRTDDYGRTLAYVWLDGCMVEDLLLESGMVVL